MSVRGRLECLERLGLYEARQARSPEDVYERIRTEAREALRRVWPPAKNPSTA